MKNLKLITAKAAGLCTIFLLALSLNAIAQTTKKTTVMKDCCMMQNGKMMMMIDGKIMPMEKNMIMTNGTTCMTNGECVMKNGKKMMMKNGDCMEMSGKMCGAKMKKMMKNKSIKQMAMMDYSCPMHPKVVSNKPGKCSKCGMALVKKA